MTHRSAIRNDSKAPCQIDRRLVSLIVRTINGATMTDWSGPYPQWQEFPEVIFS